MHKLSVALILLYSHITFSRITDFWSINVIRNGEIEWRDCFVSLLSRTPGKSMPSSDVLITDMDCILERSTDKPYTRIELNPENITLEFTHYDANRKPTEKFEHKVAQILYQKSVQEINAIKPGEAIKYVALLRLNETANSPKGLEPVILPESIDIPYKQCSMLGLFPRHDGSDEEDGDGTPIVFNVTTTGKCDVEVLDEGSDTPDYYDMMGGSPILCQSEGGQQLRGLVKLRHFLDMPGDQQMECIAEVDFLDWAKEALDKKQI